MACSLILRYVIFAAFVWKLQHVQAATRFQPSIIWDKFNPLLKCKCNWMNIPKLDIYDRVELVCPTPYLVSALRTRDISKANVFYKIFIRKFNITIHTLDELRESLNNDSFCDPTHNETEPLYTCIRDDPLGAYKLRFHSDDNLHEGDIAVIFGNADTGKEADTKSTKKKCALVFIANVTLSSKEEYDMSYGKCFIPEPESSCSNINSTCTCRGDSSKLEKDKESSNCSNISTTTATRKTDKTSTAGTEGTPTKNGQTGEKSTASTNSTTTQSGINSTAGPDVTPGESGARKSDDNFQGSWAFPVGLVVGIFIVIVANFVVYICIVKKKGKITFVKNNDEEGAPMQSKGDGFRNQAFMPVTPTAPPIESPDGGDYVVPNTTRASNGRLPSVGETSGRNNSLPPLRNKPQLLSYKRHAPTGERKENPCENADENPYENAAQ